MGLSIKGIHIKLAEIYPILDVYFCLHWASDLLKGSILDVIQSVRNGKFVFASVVTRGRGKGRAALGDTI